MKRAMKAPPSKREAKAALREAQKKQKLVAWALMCIESPVPLIKEDTLNHMKDLYFVI